MATLDRGKEAKLTEIVGVTNNGGFVWSHPIAMHALAAQGLVEAHPTLRSTDGTNSLPEGQAGKMHAFRATPAGIEHITSINQPTAEGTAQIMNTAVQPATPAVAPAAAPKPTFDLETGHAPSAVKRRGGARPEVYPFAQMEVGQSFFVPASATRPEPHTSLASTVNTAMQRYAEVDPTGSTRVNKQGATVAVTKRTRVFQLEKAMKDGVNGARIFRTA